NSPNAAFPVAIGEKTRVNNLDILINDFTIGFLKNLLIEKIAVLYRNCIEKKLEGKKLNSPFDAIKEIFSQNSSKGIHLIIQLHNKTKTIIENLFKQLPKIDTSQHVFTISQFSGTKGDTIALVKHISEGSFEVKKSSEYLILVSLPDTWCIINRKEPQIGYDFGGKLIIVSSPKKEVEKFIIKA
ncbi:19878_t:CDS:2, partial [Dentiscutata erythropus]